MRLTILTNKDAASALALHWLQPVFDSHEVSVFYTSKASRSNPSKRASKTNLTNNLASLAQFERSLEETDSILSARGGTQLNDVNSAEGIARIGASSPELVISIRHMTILKPHIISLPTLGTLNLHSGLLPNYKGVMATFWSMLNGEKSIGTTLHFIEDESIDTGAILKTSKTPVDYKKSYFWNTLNLYKCGCENIISTVKALDHGQALSSVRQTGNGNYFSFPEEEQVRKADFTLFRPTDRLVDFLNEG